MLTAKNWSIILLSLAIAACSSGKKEIILEEETDESLLAKGNTELETGNYTEAIKIYDMLLINFPTSDLHIDAQLNTAKALGGQEKFEEQFDLLLRLLRENVIPERVPEIFLQIGDFYANAAVWNPGDVSKDTTDWTSAARYYRKAAFYPDSEDNQTKSKALFLAGVMYARIRQIDTAKRAYEGVISTFPGTPYAELAKIKLVDPSNTEVLTPAQLEEVPEETPVVSDQKKFQQTLDETQDKDIQDMIMDSEQDSLFQEKPVERQEYFETEQDTSGVQEFFETEQDSLPE